jgi:NAD(P)-dependent dehydrogenase (short-subunit alcohol dehydrogenase family)
MTRLKDKVAIVTGAGSGIGKAGVQLFSAEGAKVIVVDVDESRVRETVRSIVDSGGTALGSVTDVSDPADVASMVALAIEAYGQVDILWNNAGTIQGIYTPFEDITDEMWHRTLAVNLHGVFYTLKQVIPHMKQRRRGAIINTASVAGLVAHIPGRAPYTASKGALISLTRLLALELSGFNIRVNAIAPGNVHTSVLENSPPAPRDSPFGFDWVAPNRPTPVTDATRVAEPAEIAQTALYLACDEVGPLTGTVIAHDGGRTSR